MQWVSHSSDQNTLTSLLEQTNPIVQVYSSRRSLSHIQCLCQITLYKIRVQTLILMNCYLSELDEFKCSTSNIIIDLIDEYFPF